MNISLKQTYWSPNRENPKTLIDEILTEFAVSPTYQPLLSHYYLLHWERQHFFSSIIPPGILIHRGIEYLVIYHNHRILECKKASRLALSFRRLDVPYSTYGYVIVKPLPEAISETETND